MNLSRPLWKALILTAALSCNILVLAGFTIRDSRAQEVNFGEIRSIIRAAGYPCAHVISVNAKSKDEWVVACNSGLFLIVRDPKETRVTVMEVPESAK